MSFFRELRRRSVFRVAAAYAVTAWLVIQVVETILPAFGIGDAAVRIVTIGFILLVIAWPFELTPEGLEKESDSDRWCCGVSILQPIRRQCGAFEYFSAATATKVPSCRQFAPIIRAGW